MAVAKVINQNPLVTTTGRVARATRRLGELKITGVQLSELLGGAAGAAFIRDYCDGDDVAYAAIALVHNPSAYKHWIEEKDNGLSTVSSPSCLPGF